MADKFLKTLKLPGIDEPYKIPQTAEDVGARPSDWMPSAEDVGAVSIHGDTVTGPFNVSGNMSINNGDFNMNGRKVWNLPTPNGRGDAANKGYVDDGLSTKAPAGFGLGGENRNISSVKDVSTNGWWLTNVNTPDGEWWEFNTNIANGGQDIIVDAHKHQDCWVARRVKKSNDWQPWEWVNPPMVNGHEYRTTERYDGKPVYTKLFTTGAMTNGSWMVYAQDATKPIRCFVTDAGGPVLLPRYAGGALQGGMYTFWYDVEGNQFCAYHGSAYGAVQYNVQIWYVK